MTAAGANATVPAISDSEIKIKVAHIVETLQPGGLENVVATLVKRLDRRRFDPSVIVLAESGSLEERIIASGTPVQVVGKRPGFDLDAARRLRALLLAANVDLLHTHNPIANHWTILATLGMSRRPPIILSEHSIHYRGRVSLFYPWIRALLGLRNAAIVGVCENVTASHAAIDPVNRSKYLTIHNGIEPMSRVPELDVQDLRATLGLGVGRVVIGTIGNLRPAKAHSDLLQAFARLVAGGCDAELVVAGDGPMRDELARETQRLGLDGRVRWIGRRSDIDQLLSVFDIFVLSSRREGFPVAVIEAASVGVPIVATDVGGVSEVVRTDETGILVPPAAPEMLATALGDAIRNPAKSNRMARTARAKFEVRFTAEVMTRKTEELYERVLKERYR